MPPPAVVHSHPVEAPLGPGEDADGVAEAGTLFCVSPPEETPHDTALADAAWIQAGIEEDISCHIAAFESAHVPQGVSADYHPPEGDPPLEDAPPFPAAPAEPPWPHDASAVAEPVSPHTLPLGATPVGSAPESDLPPLDATQISLLEAPAGAPLRPMQAAAPILREELAAVAAREAAEAAEGAAVAAIVSPSQLAEERVLGTLLKLARDIRQPRRFIGLL